VPASGKARPATVTVSIPATFYDLVVAALNRYADADIHADLPASERVERAIFVNRLLNGD